MIIFSADSFSNDAFRHVILLFWGGRGWDVGSIGFGDDSLLGDENWENMHGFGLEINGFLLLH